jgi:hypothetical protein
MSSVVRSLPQSDKLVFMISKSSDENFVAYEYNETDSGFTIDPYWINVAPINNTEPLNVLEHSLYGININVQSSGECSVYFNAQQIRTRKCELIMDASGKPALLGQINGQPCRLQYAYAQMRKGLIPDVHYLHLYGRSTIDGSWHKEKIENDTKLDSWLFS